MLTPLTHQILDVIIYCLAGMQLAMVMCVKITKHCPWSIVMISFIMTGLSVGMLLSKHIL